jgi:hypothetical protein
MTEERNCGGWTTLYCNDFPGHPPCCPSCHHENEDESAECGGIFWDAKVEAEVCCAVANWLRETKWQPTPKEKGVGEGGKKDEH